MWPYEVNAPLWSDGAGKKRYLVLPEDGRIRYRSDGAWELPDGTVLVKSFYVGERIAETRLLIKRTGYPGWDGYSYRWNDDRNEAFLLEVAGTVEYPVSSPEGGRTHSHYFPSRGQCGDCHTPASGYVLGLRTGQMNRDGLIENWEREGLFAGELPAAGTWAKWPQPEDESLPLVPRARAYLAANCANCHRPEHGSRALFDLRFDTPLKETGILESARLGNLGIHEARIVERGEPLRSLLYVRMLETGRWRMPPLATALVDTQGAGLVGRWIERLGDPTAVEVAMGEQALPRELRAAAAVPQPGQRNPVDPVRPRCFRGCPAGGVQPGGPAGGDAVGGDEAGGRPPAALGQRRQRDRRLRRPPDGRRPHAVAQGDAAALSRPGLSPGGRAAPAPSPRPRGW